MVSEGRPPLGEEDERVPSERILSTTFFMSAAARNCPFLTLTGLPVCATATMRSVCRQRNAGICITSRTSAGGDHLGHLMDVGEHGDAERVAHLAKDAEPFEEPRAAVAVDRRAVGLVVRRLVDERDATLGGDRGQPLGRHQRVLFVLDRAGAPDQRQRRAAADRDGPDPATSVADPPLTPASPRTVESIGLGSAVERPHLALPESVGLGSAVAVPHLAPPRSCSSAARTNPAKSGCGSHGRERNSGWN